MGIRRNSRQDREQEIQEMVDFHIHTTCTDGMMSPEQVIRKAIRSGLKAIALTDHNYINEDLGSLRKQFGNAIQLVNGMELSTKYTGITGKATEVHIVALGFDNDAMRSVVARNQRDNEGYINEMCTKLRRCGLDMPLYDGMKKAYPRHQRMQRLQLADYMVKHGFVKNLDEAFERYIGAHGERRAYADPLKYADYIPLKDGVAAIRAAGGIPVLPHLFKYRFDERENMRLIQMFTEAAGRDAAMEVYYGRYTKGKQYRLSQIADNWRILWSSGSDFHARVPEENLMSASHMHQCPLGKHVVNRLAARGDLK